MKLAMRAASTIAVADDALRGVLILPYPSAGL
jgi:hypothetical protein